MADSDAARYSKTTERIEKSATRTESGLDMVRAWWTAEGGRGTYGPLILTAYSWHHVHRFNRGKVNTKEYNDCHFVVKHRQDKLPEGDKSPANMMANTLHRSHRSWRVGRPSSGYDGLA
jgi:hypothetical protein